MLGLLEFLQEAHVNMLKGFFPELTLCRHLLTVFLGCDSLGVGGVAQWV